MESDSEATASHDAPKGKPIALYGVIAIGLAIGAGVGLFVVGPTFAKRASAQAPAASAEHGAREPGKAREGKDGKAESGAAKTLHVVDNLVLNPAGSGGTRFLMVNATFELQDGTNVELLKTRDAEVRDVLLALLGSKTVEQLTDISTRDVLKKEMIAALAPLFPKGTINRVYFPQFVIQ
ncbi:MAG: fliL [Gemmatimonadetes bacterium]|nr:fliL [Gemmatimonadota bacterium]